MGVCFTRNSKESPDASTIRNIRGSHIAEVTADDGRPIVGAKSFKLFARDPKHIFDIIFTQRPLGVHLTTDSKGKCAYVTETSAVKNKVVDKNKLPKFSKLIRVNNINVEYEDFDIILMLVFNKMKDLPMTLTFCHPDGLDEDERPDPNPPNENLNED